jgi:hypothetical protein
VVAKMEICPNSDSISIPAGRLVNRKIDSQKWFDQQKFSGKVMGLGE